MNRCYAYQFRYRINATRKHPQPEHTLCVLATDFHEGYESRHEQVANKRSARSENN
jgi:hypothetical protein